MHEMALCEGIREVIEAQARAHGVDRIARVRVEIGRFSGVERAALDFAFDVVMRGSVAEDATLVIVDLPGRARCFGCGADVEIDSRLASCPSCGSGQLLTTGGDEMRIKDMEAA